MHKSWTVWSNFQIAFKSLMLFYLCFVVSGWKVDGLTDPYIYSFPSFWWSSRNISRYVTFLNLSCHNFKTLKSPIPWSAALLTIPPANIQPVKWKGISTIPSPLILYLRCHLFSYVAVVAWTWSQLSFLACVWVLKNTSRRCIAFVVDKPANTGSLYVKLSWIA